MVTHKLNNLDKMKYQNDILSKNEKYQKTILKPIKVSGISIHDKKIAKIVLSPANSGDGRYFVINKEKSFKNAIKNDINSTNLNKLITKSMPDIDSITKNNSVLLSQRENGYSGNFQLYTDSTFSVNQDTRTLKNPQNNKRLLYKPINSIDASIENVVSKPTWQLSLEKNFESVNSIEHLLSTLEALSIDNLRIDISDGNHIPILDGSAIGWVDEIAKAKITYSKSNSSFNSKNQYEKRKKKLRSHANKFITLNSNDSFISYYPDTSSKITVGLDLSKNAPIIGKQWFSYNIFEDDHYKWEIAPARMYINSLDQLYKATDIGYFKTGIENTINVANFDSWLNSDSLRYYNTECARHEILDIIGCLGLLSYKGNGGIPFGHIVAYKPDLELTVRFVKLLKELLIF